jgi:hypothetical protein
LANKNAQSPEALGKKITSISARLEFPHQNRSGQQIVSGPFFLVEEHRDETEPPKDQ